MSTGIGKKCRHLIFKKEQYRHHLHAYDPINIYWASALMLQLTSCLSPPLANRTPERCPGSSRIHPEDVRGPEPRQWQNYLLPLHVRHRHREHPLCLCCRQGHHPPVEPEGVQSGLIVPPRHRPSLPWWAIEAVQEGLYFCGKQCA